MCTSDWPNDVFGSKPAKGRGITNIRVMKTGICSVSMSNIMYLIYNIYNFSVICSTT